MENQDYETIDLLEVLTLMRQHILALVLSVVIAAAGGFVISAYLIIPQYEASALMIVNTRQDTTTNVTSDQINSAAKLVSTYGIIIKSDTVLQQIINNMELNLDYASLNSKVSVSAVDATQVMKVTVTDANADIARRICEQITQVAPDVILDSVEAGSVKVISAASINPTPVSPNVLRDTVLAGLIGLVLCLGIIFLREMLDNKIKNEDDVTKYLGLSVIGVIPNYEVGGTK